MVRHAVMGATLAAFAATSVFPSSGLADGYEHHRHRHVARTHACRPVIETWDPVVGAPWPPIAYLSAAFGPATGAATRLPCGYWPECIRYPHHRLHCTYPY